jgi:hypothetical protein
VLRYAEFGWEHPGGNAMGNGTSGSEQRSRRQRCDDRLEVVVAECRDEGWEAQRRASPLANVAVFGRFDFAGGGAKPEERQVTVGKHSSRKYSPEGGAA